MFQVTDVKCIAYKDGVEIGSFVIESVVGNEFDDVVEAAQVAYEETWNLTNIEWDVE
ncbi:hypothetical protein BPS13_0130 [Bacillus phage BPS13]|uniref:Uncharacterized protein n=3 Tax=Wphvirus TaxID=1922327 RepID=W5QUA6_9CAUD|nr:hypothetical protein BPS13_0130 [Bacillus phage BPS13]YP_009003015.1 hypothetical protein BPS10C_129 [Bacillus phage BPS10C]YP_009282182.1 hypothetical protein SALINJAH_228 [Bacillus phage SalinJah]QQO38873.1 hypothetical protein BCPG1_142 [Bacillus phage BCPG1]AEZ50309.1 hypothetical protein BPS13_0130 [Bacillus phage BPS13]AGI12126.1 hypothetical protein BPS10C_129 [Bacillus phage BPS10C]ANH50784.1 hypothetical protein SALINJAH_228 [Bacillus phage SalinJah]